MILKFQQGGAAPPPLIAYNPVMVTPPAASPARTTETGSSKADLTDKDLLEMVGKLDGLPSDIQLLTSELQNFYIDQKHGVNTASLASKYINILSKVKITNFNKKEYDNAFELVSKNGGINEYAIDDRGRLFCVNKTGDFKYFSAEELKSNEEYTPLTNSELLYYRAQSPDMANKNNILKIVKNGISIDMVTKTITDIISKLGTTQKTEEGYGKVKAGQIVSGMNDFMQAVKQASIEKHNGTIHDLYKYKYLTKDQLDQANQAMTYIYSTLPENMKSLLKIKSGKFSDEGAKELMQILIASQIDNTKDFTLDLEGGPTVKSNAKSNGTTKDGTDLKTSLPLNVQKGIGGYIQPMIVDRGDGTEMNITGTYYQQLKTPEGKTIINTSLESMLADSGLQSIVKNINNITFGDQKLTNEQLANITYNNTGVIRANLPVNEDGSVRLDILEDFQKAEAEVELLGKNASTEAIANIYKEYGLDDLLNHDGSLNKKRFAPFIVTEGYTTENNGITNSSYVYKIKNPTEQQIDLIKKSLTIGTGKDKEVPDIDTFSWYNPFDWFGVEDIYRAAIYIPINNNVNSAVYGADQELDYDEAHQQEIKYRNFEKASRMNSTSADIL